MNDWQAKKERQALRADLLAIVEQQKAVIGALARGLTQAQADIRALQQWRDAAVDRRLTPDECQRLVDDTQIPLTALDGTVYHP